MKTKGEEGGVWKEGAVRVEVIELRADIARRKFYRR